MMNSNNNPQETNKLITGLDAAIQDIMNMDMSKFTDEKFCKNLYEGLNFPNISKDLKRMYHNPENPKRSLKTSALHIKEIKEKSRASKKEYQL